jgi:hypothetical protein
MRTRNLSAIKSNNGLRFDEPAEAGGQIIAPGEGAAEPGETATKLSEPTDVGDRGGEGVTK